MPAARSSNTTDPTGRPVDLAIGAFSDDPPWLVEPDHLDWSADLDLLRWHTTQLVPKLIAPRRLPHAGRMALVTARVGGAVVLWAALGRRTGGSGSKSDISRRLRRAAERLGPTYIKLAQIISSGEGIFPEELVTELKLCRDRVPPESFSTVRRVVQEDLGAPLEEIFSSFDREPIAAASIAQVHGATLRTGERVVVKVQRPSVERLVTADLEVMAWLAPFMVGRIPISALANPPALVELFAETIVEELDFRLEAQNMLDVARSFAELNQRSYVIPRPHPTLVTRRVLVMERLDGYAFDDVVGMQAGGVDTTQVVRAGMIGFLEGAMLHGIFHGDLHGGNLLVLPDGRTALLDFGITGRMGEFKRLAFLRLLLGGTMNDVRVQLEALRDLGALPPDADLDSLIVELGLDRPPVDPTTMDPDELVKEIQKILKSLLGHGAAMPKELMLFVKNMVFLDGAIATLAPELDLFAEIEHLAVYFAEAHGDRIAAQIGVDPTAYEVDMTGIKASFGLDSDIESLTYQDLQQRRTVIRERLSSRGRGRRRRKAG